jgi:Domain of unknown function (DUF1707)
MPPGPPRPLADDAGRERLLRLLREHYARGELELDDLSRRVGLVLAALYADEVAAALAGLPQLPADGGAPGAGNSTAPGAGGRRPARRWRRGHAQAAVPGAGWVPTDERFRDPTTRTVMRVWIDPSDLSRHYVPEPEG